MRKAIFPGSFDPVTVGHVDIVTRAIPLFDEIVVAVGINRSKKSFLPMETRLEMLERTFEDYPNVRVASYEGVTVDFAQAQGIGFMLRGLRNAQDLDYENYVAQINKFLAAEMETVFLIGSPDVSHISSSMVREIVACKRSVEGLVPDAALQLMPPLD